MEQNTCEINNTDCGIMIVDWNKADSTTKQKIMKRSQVDINAVRKIAAEWFAKIESQGDDALVEYVNQFDNKNFTKNDIKVTAADIQKAYEMVDPKVVEIIKKQIEISKEFHSRQAKSDQPEVAEYVPGVKTGWKTTPIDSVGFTVPAGQVPLPTVMQILTISAKAARVPRIIACFPPTGPHYEMLIAADIAGVDEIYRVGGIAGIAAMSIGTQTIKPVLKICGPGSIYTQAAKIEASLRGTAIDMVSGPSEALIISDRSTKAKYCAADILARCEHDQNACAVLATTSIEFAKEVAECIKEQLPKLKRKDVAAVALQRYSAIAVFDNMEQIVAFTNEYSPEHLEILTEDPWDLCSKIHNAGSIFLGNYAPVAVGDYASGTNHCLPTGIFPKTCSPICVDTFLKKSEIQYLTKEGLKNLEPIISTISDIETLDAHKNSVLIRFED